MRVRRSSPYFSFSAVMSSRMTLEDQLRIRRGGSPGGVISARTSLSSSSIFLRSRPARRARRMSRIAVGLDLGQGERLHQVGARGLGRARGADGGDHRVDVVERDLETFEDVGAAAGSLQLELGAPGDDLLAVGDVLLQRPFQRQ